MQTKRRQIHAKKAHENNKLHSLRLAATGAGSAPAPAYSRRRDSKLIGRKLWRTGAPGMTKHQLQRNAERQCHSAIGQAFKHGIENSLAGQGLLPMAKAVSRGGSRNIAKQALRVAVLES
jgi:hypothetical protein